MAPLKIAAAKASMQIQSLRKLLCFHTTRLPSAAASLTRCAAISTTGGSPSTFSIFPICPLLEASRFIASGRIRICPRCVSADQVPAPGTSATALSWISQECSRSSHCADRVGPAQAGWRWEGRHRQARRTRLHRRSRVDSDGRALLPEANPPRHREVALGPPASPAVSNSDVASVTLLCACEDTRHAHRRPYLRP
jgi:hypothetical protein